MGLGATGSVDAACQKLFVPDFMTLAASATRGDPTPGSALNPGPLYRQSVAGLFPNLIGTLMLGVAQGTWDLSVESFRDRSARSSGTKISELVPVQMKVAETGAQIDAARALLKSNFDEARRYAEAGKMPPVDAKLRWRRDGSYIVKLASDATNGLHRIAGAGALYSSGHLQRHVRDVASGLTHAHVSWEINAPAYGRVALGLETDNPLI
jgi:3-hydroxy-9,10-secoandrosta-1,3,5(10)-triene-9,17-dione monooxygenase